MLLLQFKHDKGTGQNDRKIPGKEKQDNMKLTDLRQNSAAPIEMETVKETPMIYFGHMLVLRICLEFLFAMSWLRYDEGVAWKRFSHYWQFVKGIY